LLNLYNLGAQYGNMKISGNTKISGVDMEKTISKLYINFLLCMLEQRKCSWHSSEFRVLTFLHLFLGTYCNVQKYLLHLFCWHWLECWEMF